MRATSQRVKQRESAQRWKGRQQGGERVRQRWERGGCKCEGCGEVVDIVEVAHLAGKGRSAKVAERWASSEYLMAALCCSRTWNLSREGCHEMVDRGRAPDKLRGLRILGLLALCTAYKVDPPEWAEADPLGAIRAVVGVLEAS